MATKRSTRKPSLTKQANDIFKMAENAGLENNYYFQTTFKRYQVQISILEELEKKIKEEGTLVTKEYVKGRGNLYCNPAVTEYNRTTDSANKTVSTLIKIIKGFGNVETDNGADPLLAIINGGDEPDEE